MREDEQKARRTANIREAWERLHQLVPRNLEQITDLLRPRRWRDVILQPSAPAEPTGPLLLDSIGLIDPAGHPGSSAEVGLKPKPVSVPLASATLAFAVSVGRASLANRDPIVIQAASIEVLLKDAIDRLKQLRPNSESIPELEAIQKAILEFRHLLSGMPPADAVAGTKALCIRDGLVRWWNRDSLSIVDCSFEMGLFTGALVLCAQAGLIPPAKIASLVRGRQLRDALSEAVKLLAGGS